MGQICGQRGVISLETGEAAGKFDESNGRTASLPFQLRLKNFVVDKRRPEFRLYVISKHNDENKIVASFDASKPAIHDLPGGGQVEVRAFTSGERPNIADSNNAGVAGSSVLSDPSDPSVRLSLRSRDNAGSEVILKGSGPASISLGNEERELRFAKKSDDIANFVSTLGIETNGNQVFSREVRVNQPLNYGGYSFYQASYDPKNPRYSGLLVVRDPGLGFVYVGIIAVLFGIMHILLVRPRREPKEVEVA